MPTRRTPTTPRRSRSTGRACTRATASRFRRTPPCSKPGGTITPATSSRRSRRDSRRAARASMRRSKAQVVYANYLEKARQGEARAVRGSRRLGRRAPRAPRPRTPTRTTCTRSRSAATARASRSPRRSRRASAARSRRRCRPRSSSSRSTPTRSTAYGAYQAEVIDKVGGIVAGMTYGAKKDSALEYFQKALKLFPESPIAHIEYANGLMHAVRQGARSTRRRSSTKRRPRRSRRTRWSASTSSSRSRSSNSAGSRRAPRQRRDLADRDRRRAATGSSAWSARAFRTRAPKRAMTRSGSGHSPRSVTTPNCTAPSYEMIDTPMPMSPDCGTQNIRLSMRRAGEIERLLRARHVGHHRRRVARQRLQQRVLQHLRARCPSRRAGRAPAPAGSCP